MSIKKLITKATALLCISGVVLAGNAPYVKAYEAHVMNVTARIIDNSVVVTPNGGKFCNDGKLKIEMASSLEEAEMYYTVNGSEPVCGSNGTLYTGPFTLLSTKTVKAVSCYNGKQSRTVGKTYEVCASYCESSLKVNKVYYSPDKAHQAGTCNNENEWVEIYNPSTAAVNLKNWKICDAEACDIISSRDLSIPAKGYAIVTYKDSTWGFWNVPAGTVKIALGNAIGNGLNNTADLVMLKNPSGQTVDQMNWGTPNSGWANYNSGVWNPALAAIAEGKIYARDPNGYDTDKPSDWKALSLPSVEVNFEEEAWMVGNVHTINWKAAYGNATGANLKIDLYYSSDQGKTWTNIVKGAENDGVFDWRIPLSAKCGTDEKCLNPSSKISIKAVANDTARTALFSGKDIQDKDFSSSIDKNLLTAEELSVFQNMDVSGLSLASPSVFGGRTGVQTASEAKKDSGSGSAELKQSIMLNKEDDFDEEEKDENAGGEDEKDSKEEIKNAAAVSVEKIIEEKISGIRFETDAPIISDGDIVIEFNLNA